MPNQGVVIDHKDGELQIIMSAGHQHWYWIKSGWIFRVAGAGYAALNIANGLISGDFSLSENKTQLGIATGVFLFGVVLKRTYKLTFRLGKKYRLETLNFQAVPVLRH